MKWDLAIVIVRRMVSSLGVTIGGMAGILMVFLFFAQLPLIIALPVTLAYVVVPGLIMAAMSGLAMAYVVGKEQWPLKQPARYRRRTGLVGGITGLIVYAVLLAIIVGGVASVEPYWTVVMLFTGLFPGLGLAMANWWASDKIAEWSVRLVRMSNVATAR